MRYNHLSTSGSAITRDGWRMNYFILEMTVPALVLSLWVGLAKDGRWVWG